MASIAPRAAEGAVEGVAEPGTPLQLSGWAAARPKPRPVDWVLLFAGDRLVAVTAGGGRRADVAARKGPRTLLAGFGLAPLPPPPKQSRLRVFGVVGSRATELPLTARARRTLEARRSSAP